jgi:type II secretory ATPase GspE/PulE/Tfp pilus assembly ATPase PilB-like protein
MQRLPYAGGRALVALPLMMRGGRLVVAMEDPTPRKAIDEIEFAASCKVMPVLARAGTLFGAIERAYEKIGIAAHWLRRRTGPSRRRPRSTSSPNAGKLLATLEQANAAARRRRRRRVIEQSDNSLVRLINSMILEAQAQGVSDIHIECRPGAKRSRCASARTAVLRPYLELPHTYRSALIARSRSCATSTSPSAASRRTARSISASSCRAAARTARGHHPHPQQLRRRGAAPAGVGQAAAAGQAGPQPANLERLKTAGQRPYGMILCVGPTGSGKTTTLHSAMGYINTPERKIWTAEDPIEITQAGLRQVQVNAAHRLDLRQGAARLPARRPRRDHGRRDPRQGNRRQVAIEASLTGHLVMSTLHTNSAAETVTRLLDMGMDPFNFADALLVVLAQRLVRRLCRNAASRAGRPPRSTSCWPTTCTPSTAWQRPSEDDVLADWRQRFGRDGRLQLYHAQGLRACEHSGLPRPRRHARADAHDARSLRTSSRPAAAPRRSCTRRWPRACARCARTASRRCWPA